MTQLTDPPAATGPAATAVPAPARPANAPAAVPAAVPLAEGAYLTGAEALVRSLETVGVDTVFGIPGGAILPAYDPLMDSTRLRHVLVRHEQGAGHAATGYAQATGRVGVCMATSGPG
ncbi:thiamine pyrophosphate-binding protein, partial [Kitasatospora phosalacinea]